jgi:HPt (histidine-containing phosphotransfer) domain-containing protein
MAIGIPGVDEEVFNDLFDGDEGLYTSVARSFVDKTPSVVAKLANVSQESLAEYATNIHGLKGACANVCAEEARKAAMELETLSRKGDLAGVQSKNGAFLKIVENLMGGLQKWLKTR